MSARVLEFRGKQPAGRSQAPPLPDWAVIPPHHVQDLRPVDRSRYAFHLLLYLVDVGPAETAKTFRGAFLDAWMEGGDEACREEVLRFCREIADATTAFRSRPQEPAPAPEGVPS